MTKISETAVLGGRVYDPSTHVLKKRAPTDEVASDVPLSIIEMAQRGMTEVVWGVAGTARKQQDDSCRIAGKTGTAQNAHGDDHGWFICYGPVDNPMYSCCALIEFGKSGSGAGGPVGEVPAATHPARTLPRTL